MKAQVRTEWSATAFCMPQQYVLFESASGYALFEVVEVEEVAVLKDEVQASLRDLTRFSRFVKLKAFQVRPRARRGARPVRPSRSAGTRGASGSRRHKQGRLRALANHTRALSLPHPAPSQRSHAAPRPLARVHHSAGRRRATGRRFPSLSAPPSTAALHLGRERARERNGRV
jgi:hypothetical protein